MPEYPLAQRLSSGAATISVTPTRSGRAQGSRRAFLKAIAGSNRRSRLLGTAEAAGHGRPARSASCAHVAATLVPIAAFTLVEVASTFFVLSPRCD
jgi:hypothetical protein